MPVSFSIKVKEELSRIIPAARHCRIAETAAMVSMCGRLQTGEEGSGRAIVLRTENVTVARKYFTLLKKTFNIEVSVSVRREQNLNKSRVYFLTIDDEAARNLLMTCRLREEPGGGFMMDDELIVQRDCCRRAFIRGAFLASGSVSDPVRSYHFEIVCSREDKAAYIRKIMGTFQIPARVIRRKTHYVVYVKDSSQVVDLLNVMGAYKALMDMENVRIVKEMRNRVNRNVNCETANISKTAAAAVRQISDIEYIMDSSAFYRLPQQIRETAQLRLRYPEATLSELGSMLDPQVGKSGINHRLNKISRFAQELRDKSSDNSKVHD